MTELDMNDLELMFQDPTVTGCRSFRAFVDQNPTWPLFAHVGVLLEIALELDTQD